MSNPRRILVLIGLSVAVLIGAIVPASAGFSESAKTPVPAC